MYFLIFIDRIVNSRIQLPEVLPEIEVIKEAAENFYIREKDKIRNLFTHSTAIPIEDNNKRDLIINIHSRFHPNLNEKMFYSYMSIYIYENFGLHFYPPVGFLFNKNIEEFLFENENRSIEKIFENADVIFDYNNDTVKIIRYYYKTINRFREGFRFKRIYENITFDESGREYTYKNVRKFMIKHMNRKLHVYYKYKSEIDALLPVYVNRNSLWGDIFITEKWLKLSRPGKVERLSSILNDLNPNLFLN